MNTNEKIKALRGLMKENGVSCYIVNTADHHMSEYLHEYYKTRDWLTGFTGSQGTAVVSMDKALLWVDGRYFIQAENQISGSEFKMMKLNTPGFPTMTEWIRDNLNDGDVVAFDGRAYSQEGYLNLKSALGDKKIEIKTDFDFISEIRTPMPEYPSGSAYVLDVKYAGKSVSEKLREVRAEMKKKKVSSFIIGGLDDIAWLFNIRGSDVLYNPVVISYAFIKENEAYLYIDSGKVTSEVRKHLEESGVKFKEYGAIFDDMTKLSADEKIHLDPMKINRKLYSSIPEKCKVVSGMDFTTKLKAVKNNVEIENQRIAYIKDGVALTKFFKWLEENAANGNITELDASDRLLEFRKQGELFVEASFGSISAYGENAAMMHYSPETGDNAVLGNKSFYLIDSGGQYYNGTTDITRTIAMGELTEEEKIDYTLTLKGMINLSSVQFIEGTSGQQLDAICRQPLWDIGSDYKCGTGHGIGYMLNVHEGPHRIANVMANPVALEAGMIMSIEPGVYKEGKHGIRIENVVVTYPSVENDSGQFFKFETLTQVYIDTVPVIKELLGEKETEWLNNYHKEVYEKLSPYMDDAEKAWLKEKTKSI